jgi:hypothetical protein
MATCFSSASASMDSVISRLRGDRFEQVDLQLREGLLLIRVHAQRADRLALVAHPDRQHGRDALALRLLRVLHARVGRHVLHVLVALRR